MMDESTFLYFIFAINLDNIQLVTTQMGFENSVTPNNANLRASLGGVQGNSTIIFHAQYVLGTSLEGFDPPVTRATAVTLIGKWTSYSLLQ